MGVCCALLGGQPALGARPFQPVSGDPVLESWRWRVFPELSGLGLQCLAEGRDGSMWFGTAEGVSLYDGLDWIAYTTQDGLGGGVDTICTGADGSIYAGGRWGISRFGQGQWSQILPSPGGSFGAIKRLAMGRDGTLWAATAWGALRCQGSEFVLYTGHEGAARMQTNQNAMPVRVELLPEAILRRPRGTNATPNRSNFFEVYEDRQGRVWLGTEAGEVLNFKPALAPASPTNAPSSVGGDWTLYNEADGLILNRRPRIIQLDTGIIWVVNYGSLGRANQFDGVAWKNLRLADFGASDDCSCLLQTRDGVLWIGCNGSICAYRNGRWQVYHPPEVPIPTVRTLLWQSADGALWIGGQDADVLRLDYQTRRWLTCQNLNFQWESPQGVEWFLHRDGRIIEHAGNRWTSYGSEDGLIDTPVALIGTRKGEVWVAGSHDHTAATARFDGQRWTRFVHESLSWGVDWRAVFESSDGSLWFGASVDSSGLGKPYVGGIMQHRQGQWIQHVVNSSTFYGPSSTPNMPGLGRDPIGKFYGLGESRDGRIWGGQFVVTFYDGQTWQILPETPGPRIGTVEAIFTSREGDLWIGSRQYGVFRYDGQDWFRYHTTAGLVANTIRSINQTADGSIWVATDRGANRFDGRDWTSDVLPAALNLAREAGSYRSSPSGGLWINRSSREWNRRAWPRAAPFDTAAGEFWSVCYLPESGAPQTIITLGSEKVSQPGNLTVSWKGSDPWRETRDANLQYSFRLDDSRWSPYSGVQTHSLLALASGRHRFEVRARDQDFNVDPSPATLAFVVMPPVWQQSWFLGLMLLLTGTIAAQTVRVFRRGHDLRQSNRALAAEIEERKRIELDAEMAHQQLLRASHQAGMAEVATGVLHNVGNVLNSVNVAANVAADRIGTSKLTHLPKVADLLTEHAQEAHYLATDPKGKLIPDYLKRLSRHLLDEQQAAVKELGSLQHHIDHIKEIIAMQQQYARLAGFAESVKLTDLVEDALRLNAGGLARHQVRLVRDFQDQGRVVVERHKVLQILVNLMANAKCACDESGREDRQLTLRILPNGAGRVQIQVLDNGVGIPPENLSKIFAQGFTTRQHGHGFGLHSAANTARELGGTLTAHSDGPGEGACFTLELPVEGISPAPNSNR